jgi:hypothetical protein
VHISRRGLGREKGGGGEVWVTNPCVCVVARARHDMGEDRKCAFSPTCNMLSQNKDRRTRTRFLSINQSITRFRDAAAGGGF